ncbi:hypothetical protein PAXRUDRAFT_16226 [Paxillus rubicundulus Ve08.2h10]|uniref:Uncharacterized protein n=1 Tax=Paxillus rubicundulus Ve08.2h10 TaxID=930991 RepID=A0A0D0D7I4_9AGAM|nr:hypothetical protein PAXRUDRAFT_16226 [Paxillus rubicundulus Ve08.2h10]
MQNNLDDANSVPRSHAHTDSLVGKCELQDMWDSYGIVRDLLPFTAGFPRADIHELLSPDLLHQIIKGTFKDHLVDWVEAYVKGAHSAGDAAKILADIDHRIAAAPSFPGLRRFPEGRGFKQWTGDDSKALMKVYLPAISGHVPGDMLMKILLLPSTIPLSGSIIIAKSFGTQVSTLMDFHSLDNTPLCITESKHIKAVKKPYQRTNKHHPIRQMLLINQHLDKLAAAIVDFCSRGMLDSPLLGAGAMLEDRNPDIVRVLEA